MVKISPGNSKLGMIPSVSLPPYVTCPKNAPCFKPCYAGRIVKRRKVVKDSYDRNYNILLNKPDEFWRQVEASIMLNTFFRFHVSGDIVDYKYFKRMVQIAERQSHCQILCFTKKYEIVNKYLKTGKKLPSNLHIIFSVWEGFNMSNPFNLPEAHVRYRDGHTTANKKAYECSGNCTECSLVGCGCWTLKDGEQVVFNQH